MIQYLNKSSPRKHALVRTSWSIFLVTVRINLQRFVTLKDSFSAPPRNPFCLSDISQYPPYGPYQPHRPNADLDLMQRLLPCIRPSHLQFKIMMTKIIYEKNVIIIVYEEFEQLIWKTEKKKTKNEHEKWKTKKVNRKRKRERLRREKLKEIDR